MATLNITDDCLHPDRYIHLVYSGPDPWAVVKKISDSIKGFFHVSTSGTNNDRLNWDISGNDIQFFSTWWIKKPVAEGTVIKVIIKVQGYKSKADNVGQFSMQLSGDVIKVFKGPRIFLKPLWYTYSYLFYNNVRRRQIERCTDMLQNFRNHIKEHYNLRMTTVTGAHTVLGGQS